MKFAKDFTQTKKELRSVLLIIQDKSFDLGVLLQQVNKEFRELKRERDMKKPGSHRHYQLRKAKRKKRRRSKESIHRIIIFY